MIDNRTTHLNLPLPAGANFLSEDVERLRASLVALDAAVHLKAEAADINAALAALVDSAPAALDSLREFAAAINNDPSFGTHVAQQIAEMAAILTAVQNTVGLKANQNALDALKRSVAAFSIAPLNTADHYVERFQVMPASDYIVAGVMEFAPDAVLQIAEMQSADEVVEVVAADATVAGNAIAFGTVPVRSGATLTVAGNFQII